ncbi:MAG: Teichoic acid export ATP-binding protein TagH [Pseudomonadota bacterium]|jgi:ABC-type polysaccharide/polyol phosphate transport system ATPase subunit
MISGNTAHVGGDREVTDEVDYVVDIRHLSKVFKRKTRAVNGYTTFKQALLARLKGQRTVADKVEEPVTIGIKDLTIRIPRGASIGLIGRNGSGKSTFLKLITGIYKPTSGVVNVRGRIAALIELGAGFHPDFTGRENLVLAGIMHGLTREEINARFDDIVRFAELEHVIDDPVRTYSSGMFMRLGFSIAIHTDPDILLVDEVLAVGDAGFVAKCKDRIAELRRSGKTLILVTHDLDAVERWCDEAVWLHKGDVKDRGNPRRVIDAYRHHIEKQEEGALLEEDTAQVAAATSVDAASDGRQSSRWGSREVEITQVSLVGTDGSEKRVLHPEDTARVRMSYKVHGSHEGLVFGVGITRVDGLSVFGTNTDIDRVNLPAVGTSGVVECEIPRIGLVEGSYTFDVAVHRTDGYPYDYHKDVVHFSVRSDKREVGVSSLTRSWVVDGVRCSC